MGRTTTVFRIAVPLVLGIAIGLATILTFKAYRGKASTQQSEWYFPVPDPSSHYYVDHAGQRVFPQNFDDTRHFSDGFAMVKIDGKWGFINLKAEVAIPPSFEETYGFSEGLAAVKVGGKFGFIDWHGETVIEPQFEGTSIFSGGLVAAKLGGAWGFVDRTGRFVIQPKFAELMPFHEGLAAATTDGSKWGFIDRTGEFIIPPSFMGVRGLGFQYGTAIVMINGEWKRVDWKGKVVE